MRFVLFAEGHTERAVLGPFLKRWLDQQLSRPVGIQVVLLAGWQELYKKTGKRARMHLDGPSRAKIIAGIGLLDLYGPSFYPQAITSAERRFDWAKKEIEKRVDHRRFRMFLPSMSLKPGC
jgi:hypothetical protein